MANPENLIPQAHVLTVEDQSKGGIASQQVQKQKRTFTEAVKWLANADITIDTGKIKETFKENGIDISNLNPTQLATLGLWLGSVYGNAVNFKTLAEYNGESNLNEDAPTPSLQITIKDNSHLEGPMYEEDKHK